VIGLGVLVAVAVLPLLTLPLWTSRDWRNAVERRRAQGYAGEQMTLRPHEAAAMGVHDRALAMEEKSVRDV